jgi:outer membrane protein OmpA-like peptidoglycan-associated protein
VGHTDRVGTRENNFRLGLERAKLIQKLLISKGIDPNIISVASHGEDNPLVKTDDEVPEPRNRRVEIIIR